MQSIDIRLHAALVKAITDHRNKVANHLAKGQAADFADYKHACGILEGLRLAMELADALADEANGMPKRDVFEGGLA